MRKTTEAEKQRLESRKANLTAELEKLKYLEAKDTDMYSSRNIFQTIFLLIFNCRNVQQLENIQGQIEEQKQTTQSCNAEAQKIVEALKNFVSICQKQHLLINPAATIGWDHVSVITNIKKDIMPIVDQLGPGFKDENMNVSFIIYYFLFRIVFNLMRNGFVRSPK